jgi:RNase P subunit RPR2
MSGRRISGLADARFTLCPQCDMPSLLARSADAHIDECGFESYTFTCRQCDTPLAGIVDPADDALLLSRIAA